jgi:hypothetical protein
VFVSMNSSCMSLSAPEMALHIFSALNKSNRSCLIAALINCVVESNKPAIDFCSNQLSTRYQLEQLNSP